MQTEKSSNRTLFLLKRLDALVSEFNPSHVAHTLVPETLIRSVIEDSLDRVELIMAIEDEFITEIPDDVAERFTTFGDIATYISTWRPVDKPRPVAKPQQITGEGYPEKSSVSVMLNARQRELFHKLGGAKWLRSFLDGRKEMY